MEASWGTIHASFVSDLDVRAQVHANRGASHACARLFLTLVCSNRFMESKKGRKSVMVVANLRGASFIEDATATRPNCFALRRQVMILQKAGGGSAERQAADTRFKLNLQICPPPLSINDRYVTHSIT